jgi:hypothetical protein
VPEIDRESGEPVVELVPTTVESASNGSAPVPPRRAERRARVKRKAARAHERTEVQDVPVLSDRGAVPEPMADGQSAGASG